MKCLPITKYSSQILKQKSHLYLVKVLLGCIEMLQISSLFRIPIFSVYKVCTFSPRSDSQELLKAHFTPAFDRIWGRQKFFFLCFFFFGRLVKGVKLEAQPSGTFLTTQPAKLSNTYGNEQIWLFKVCNYSVFKWAQMLPVKVKQMHARTRSYITLKKNTYSYTFLHNIIHCNNQ